MVEKVVSTGAPAEEIARRMALAERYIEFHGAEVAEVRAIALATLRIYPEIPWSRRRTRLSAAFKRVIAGQNYTKEVRIRAKSLLYRAMADYRPVYYYT